MTVTERRDLIVATYSEVWATGARVTATVCTGIACIAGACAAWGGLQPVTIAMPPQRIMLNEIERLRMELLKGEPRLQL
jgi:hypothetical protein